MFSQSKYTHAKKNWRASIFDENWYIISTTFNHATKHIFDIYNVKARTIHAIYCKCLTLQWWKERARERASKKVFDLHKGNFKLHTNVKWAFAQTTNKRNLDDMNAILSGHGHSGIKHILTNKLSRCWPLWIFFFWRGTEGRDWKSSRVKTLMPQSMPSAELFELFCLH